jgi:hypothetical protein
MRNVAFQLTIFPLGDARARTRRWRLRPVCTAGPTPAVVQLEIRFEVDGKRRLPLILDPLRLSGEERIELLRGRVEYQSELEALDACRPKTRADCADVPRPCPFVACRWNTYLDVDERGRIVIGRPDVDVDQRAESCALDVIEQNPDGLELGDVAAILGISRDPVARIEAQGKAALARDHDLAHDHERPPAPANDVVHEEAPRRVRRERPSPTAGGDVKTRLSAALREKAILDVLVTGAKTTQEIVDALAGTANPAGYWWVRHVCRILRARELVRSRMVPVHGQDAPVLRWHVVAR